MQGKLTQMTLLTNILVSILFIVVMGTAVILLQLINNKEKSPKEVMDNLKQKLSQPRNRYTLILLVIIIVAAIVFFL